jgi:hypothetical protein
LNKARVLDRDHGLVGEGLDQADVGLGEGLDPAAQQGDHADRLAVAQHGHGEHGAKAEPRLKLANVGVFALDQREDVVDVQQPALEEGPSDDRGATQRQLVLAAEARTELGHRAQLVARDEQPDAAAFRFAQQPGALGDGAQHRLHVRRRSADHLQHLGRRRLPLERLLGLVEQPRVLDRDHRLVGEGAQQLDFLVRKSPVGG